MTRYIILGGNGFIGKGLIKFFKEKKLNFIKFNKIPKKYPKSIYNNDIIVNCMGKNLDKIANLNLMKFIKFLRDKNVKILWIQLSTPLIYDQQSKEKIIMENSKEIPFNKYAYSKLEFDNFLKKQKNSCFNYLILRVATVYDKKMKSRVFKKLKILKNSVFSPILINPKVILNYISLDELTKYIHRLSINKKSWNKLFIISQYIKLKNLLRITKKKKKISNKLFFLLKKILIFCFGEPILFLTNENRIRSKYLKQFIKIDSQKYSNKKIINFFDVC